MLATTVAIAVALMIALPIVFAVALVRRLGAPVVLLVVGALTFLIAQALRIPVLQTLILPTDSQTAANVLYAASFNIAVLSLTAGLFEEAARYFAYRHVITTARTWSAAVTFGAGHGAMESIILGGLMGAELTGMLALGAPANMPPPGQNPETQARLAEGVERYWQTPAYVPLLAVLERVFAVCFHMAMAVVVLWAVVRRSLLWLAAAVGAHAAANAIGIAALAAYGPIAAEIVVGLIAILALYLLFRLREPERLGA